MTKSVHISRWKRARRSTFYDFSTFCMIYRRWRKEATAVQWNKLFYRKLDSTRINSIKNLPNHDRFFYINTRHFLSYGNIVCFSLSLVFGCWIRVAMAMNSDAVPKLLHYSFFYNFVFVVLFFRLAIMCHKKRLIG